MLGSRGGTGGLYSARAPGDQGAPHPGTDPPLWAAPGGEGTHKAPVVGLAETPEEGCKSRAPGQGSGCHPGGLGHCQCPLSCPSGGVGAPSRVLLIRGLHRGPPSLGPRVPSPSTSPSLSRAIHHPSPSPCLARARATCRPRGAQAEEHNDMQGQRGHGRGHPPGWGSPLQGRSSGAGEGMGGLCSQCPSVPECYK